MIPWNALAKRPPCLLSRDLLSTRLFFSHLFGAVVLLRTVRIGSTQIMETFVIISASILVAHHYVRHRTGRTCCALTAIDKQAIMYYCTFKKPTDAKALRRT